jgi:uncharacterized membrane protein
LGSSGHFFVCPEFACICGNTTKIKMANKKGSDGKTSFEVMTSFQRPLPSPELLQGFENVLPGAAERIMQMAEKSNSQGKNE